VLIHTIVNYMMNTTNNIIGERLVEDGVIAHNHTIPKCNSLIEIKQ